MTAAGDEIIIRPATAADRAALAVLHGVCFARGWSEEEIAALVGAPGGGAWVAMDGREDGVPRGFVLMRHVADEAEILTLGVHPAMRRRGIARRLVAAALAALDAHGAASVFLEVAADNAAAMALYAHFAFEEVGLRRAYYGRPGGRRVDALALRRGG
jgi:ribosomal-protein-alanine N-acetyltransferase